MKLEDVEIGMSVRISNDLHNKSFKLIGRNMTKESLAGTVQSVDRIVHQVKKNRCIIRIKNNHWFAEDLDPEELDPIDPIDLDLNPESHIKPQIFDPSQLVMK